MANLNNLKKQIDSISSINEITNAMHLVASAKLNRMGRNVLETQNFVSEIYTTFNTIIKNTDQSPYLKDKNTIPNRSLTIVINSNLGLCGGYNINLNKLVLSQLKENDMIYAIGSKAISFFTNKKCKIALSKTIFPSNFTMVDAQKEGKELLALYLSGEYDEIKIAYTKFINNVTFEPTILRIFPIVKEENGAHTQTEYTFEPSAHEILDQAVHMYVNTIIYGTFVESQISEHASRRLAMKNATSNGDEIITNLKIQLNRERQSAITQEISEIIAGANAQNQ